MKCKKTPTEVRLTNQTISSEKPFSMQIEGQMIAGEKVVVYGDSSEYVLMAVDDGEKTDTPGIFSHFVRILDNDGAWFTRFFMERLLRPGIPMYGYNYVYPDSKGSPFISAGLI